MDRSVEPRPALEGARPPRTGITVPTALVGVVRRRRRRRYPGSIPNDQAVCRSCRRDGRETITEAATPVPRPKPSRGPATKAIVAGPGGRTSPGGGNVGLHRRRDGSSVGIRTGRLAELTLARRWPKTVPRAGGDDDLDHQRRRTAQTASPSGPRKQAVEIRPGPRIDWSAATQPLPNRKPSPASSSRAAADLCPTSSISGRRSPTSWARPRRLPPADAGRDRRRRSTGPTRPRRPPAASRPRGASAPGHDVLRSGAVAGRAAHPRDLGRGNDAPGVRPVRPSPRPVSSCS